MRYTGGRFPCRFDPVSLLNPFKKRPPRRRTTDQLPTLTDRIAAGVRVDGTLTGRGGYLVQGEVVGSGEIDGIVVLAAGAFWQGELAADFVKVAGRIEGNVTARVKLELEPTAVVTGNLASPVIAIAEGAVYEGTISRPRKTAVTRHPERRSGDHASPG